MSHYFFDIKSQIDKKISEMGRVVNFDHYAPTRAPPGTLPKFVW